MVSMSMCAIFRIGSLGTEAAASLSVMTVFCWLSIFNFWCRSFWNWCLFYATNFNIFLRLSAATPQISITYIDCTYCLRYDWCALVLVRVEGIERGLVLNITNSEWCKEIRSTIFVCCLCCVFVISAVHEVCSRLCCIILCISTPIRTACSNV